MDSYHDVVPSPHFEALEKVNKNEETAPAEVREVRFFMRARSALRVDLLLDGGGEGGGLDVGRGGLLGAELALQVAAVGDHRELVARDGELQAAVRPGGRGRILLVAEVSHVGGLEPGHELVGVRGGGVEDTVLANVAEVLAVELERDRGRGDLLQPERPDLHVAVHHPHDPARLAGLVPVLAHDRQGVAAEVGEQVLAELDASRLDGQVLAELVVEDGVAGDDDVGRQHPREERMAGQAELLETGGETGGPDVGHRTPLGKAALSSKSRKSAFKSTRYDSRKLRFCQ